MKQKHILAWILSGAMAVSAVSLAGCGEQQQSSKAASSATEESTKPKELSLPVSSDETIGKDYNEVYRTFTDCGFNNVDYSGLEDLKSSTDEKIGQVQTVTLDGTSSFQKGDTALSDAKIEIKYHSVKTISPPIDKFDLEHGDKTYYYEDVITQFERAGFSDISTRTVEDSSKEEGTLKDISIDGESSLTEYFGSAPVDAKIVVIYYTRQKQAATQAPEKQESKAESKAADSGSSNSSFKETMDSYEAFFDEYIAFMKKYKENPSDLTLLGEYSEMMSKYSDYMNKMDDIDTGSLSEADLAYYTEVHARITKKLAEVY